MKRHLASVVLLAVVVATGLVYGIADLSPNYPGGTGGTITFGLGWAAPNNDWEGTKSLGMSSSRPFSSERP